MAKKLAFPQSVLLKWEDAGSPQDRYLGHVKDLNDEAHGDLIAEYKLVSVRRLLKTAALGSTAAERKHAH